MATDGQYWCCKADFGQYEATCKNFVATDGLRGIAEQLWNDTRTAEDHTLFDATMRVLERALYLQYDAFFECAKRGISQTRESVAGMMAELLKAEFEP